MRNCAASEREVLTCRFVDVINHLLHRDGTIIEGVAPDVSPICRGSMKCFPPIALMRPHCAPSAGRPFDASIKRGRAFSWKHSRNNALLAFNTNNGSRVEPLAAPLSILLVEDDAEIGEFISLYLATHNIHATFVTNGKDMDAAFSAGTYDLLILDLNLPGEDGLSICRRVRTEKRIPIIILTAQAEDVDKILGLEMGADDYIVKPFNSRELLARIRAVLRRVEAPNAIDDRTARQAYLFAGWHVDILAREVVAPCGIKVAMTAAEFDLLHALCENPNRVLTRDQLINMTHGPTSGPFERSIDVLISRLRQKIEADPKKPLLIQTVRSEGYIFSTQVTYA